MPRLQGAIVAAALALTAATPAFADGYYRGLKDYGYAPALEVIEAPEEQVVYGDANVKIDYRGLPSYGYGGAYIGGPSDPLWRQRDVAFDAVFTEDKRIVYDAGRAAQTRAVIGPYGATAYYGPQPVVIDPFVDPAGSCGTFRYWNGAGCVDARFYSRYKNPYKWKYLRK